VPFEVAGDVPLTEKIAVRVTAAEKVRLQEDALVAGLTVSALVRRRYFGRPVVASTDMTTIRELRRIGGLLKHLHQESGGAYRAQTAEALGELGGAISALARGQGGRGP
jgi:hypothetical protein